MDERLHWTRFAPYAALGLAGAAGLFLRATLGDYPQDAGPAIGALVAGHPVRALDLQPLMGSLSVLVRAPFAYAAKAAGAGETGMYRAGLVPCVAALTAVGLWLARSSRNGVVLVLAIATPASFAAVKAGHPEELLGAALCVAALLLADRRPVWAGLALGLALATKQWALLAVVPVVVAAPRGRRRGLVLAALGAAAALTLPLLAAPGAFSGTATNAAGASTTAVRATVWYLVAAHHDLRVTLPGGVAGHVPTATIPGWVARMTHPLIVAVSPLLAFLFARRRKLGRSELLALLALIFLARCVLDPVNNEYYHVPFLLSLLAFEATSRRNVAGLPPLTVLSAAGLWLTFDVLDAGGAAGAVTNAVYLGWVAVVAAFLLQALGALPVVRLVPRALQRA
jgi:Glycosyltransferase family 87